jgi:hypothetical protein
MSNLTQYVRKCKDCQGEILMKNLGDKWAALEKDGNTQHRCKNTQPQPQPQPQPQAQAQTTTNHKIGIVTGGNEAKPIEITAPKTVQNDNIDVHHTDEDKLIDLQKRLSKLEHTIKCMVKGYQSQ